MNDPDELIRISKFAFELTMKSEYERGFDKAVEILSTIDRELAKELLVMKGEL